MGSLRILRTDMTENQLNPFQASATAQAGGALVETESNRAIAEVQSAMVIAQRFPRQMDQVMDNILQACQRPTLAESALYAYPKGGQMVTGASIRLAEAIAQSYKNIQFGIRELSQEGGESTVEAFAWDVENNCRQTKTFHVKHTRKARGQIKKLDDPRDIYEMVANQGARRMRACILGVVPSDLVDAAVRQCEITQANLGGATEDQLKSLIDAFKGIGVDAATIERRLGHKMDATIGAEIIGLRKIYRSISDGMSKIMDWFDLPEKKEKADLTKAAKANAEEVTS